MTKDARRTAAWIGVCALAIGALVAAVATQFTRGDHSLDRVRQAGVLRVGYSIEAPFAVVGPDGAVSGQSIECAAEVAHSLGVRIEWVQTELDRQIPDLLAGRFDAIGAGLFVSPERAHDVLFSLPTLRIRPAWLTRAGSVAPTLQTLRGGWTVAVVRGSAAERQLANLGFAEKLQRIPDVRTGVAGLTQRLYDAVALPWPVGRSLVERRPDELAVWPADDGRPDREVALAFRPEDRSLAVAADAALATWVRSPAYRAVLTRHGLSTDDLPTPLHAPDR
jgi:polar amino acid transport system substrate-binding protein